MRTLPLLDRPTQVKVLPSAIDDSVNLITEGTFPGTVEARYVRRADEYFIVYLSSQTACNKACRFCHLTQTGQTLGIDLPVEGIVEQAEQVLSHYDTLDQPARSVHYNFMARGEVFANRHVRENGDRLVATLSELAAARGLVPRLKFSTIMPVELSDLELTDIFQVAQPDLYYSLYSVDPAFRRRWMPKAIEPEQALAKLVRWQQLTRKIPVLHWAFIEGENDSAESVQRICETVQRAGLLADFNIVRYNPYSERQGREPSEEVLDRNAQILADAFPAARIKVVGRVGFDVNASCGMFVAGKGARRPAFTGQCSASEPSRTKPRRLR